jgi:hypothetical protein
MAKSPLTKDSEFIVGEEKVLVYILAVLFLGLFIYGLVDAILRGFTKLSYTSYLFFFALLPAFIFFRKGRSNMVYLRINKNGIYENERLLTPWQGFLNAYLTQQKKLINVQDNFQLVVEYTKDNSGQGFRRKIPLTNTQNKSEEEVLEAIKFFWEEYSKMRS